MQIIALIRYHPIATFEALVAGRHGIDYRDFVAVNLSCSHKFSINQTESMPRLAVRLVEIVQHGCLIVRKLDSRNAPHEPVTTTGAVQRGKCFDRQNATSQANSLPSWSSLRNHR